MSIIYNLRWQAAKTGRVAKLAPEETLEGQAATAIMELLDAIEDLLSADPDMPTYDADYEAAQAVYEKYQGDDRRGPVFETDRGRSA